MLDAKAFLLAVPDRCVADWLAGVRACLCVCVCFLEEQAGRGRGQWLAL